MQSIDESAPGKGARTRHAIIEAVTHLFNRKGYAASTIRDICEAGGIQKGGLYNHFHSKNEIVLESFDWARQQLGAALDAAMAPVADASAQQRLIHLAESFCALYENDTYFPAGCPVLNTGIEAKGEMDILRAPARDAMAKFRGRIVDIGEAGIDSGELPADLDLEHLADIFAALLEGAMFLSVLNDDTRYLHNAVDHLRSVVLSLNAEED